MSKFFSSKQSQTTESSSTPTFPSWIEPELQSLLERTVGLTSQEYTPYGGERVAGLSTDEQAAYDLVRGLTGSTQEAYGQAQDITSQVAQRGLEGYTPEQIQQYMNPYQQQVMDISKRRQLEDFETAKNNLAAQQANIGAFGGSRAGLAEQQLYNDFAQQLADTEAQQLYTGYADALQQAQYGTQLAGTAAEQMGTLASSDLQSALQQATALESAGATQRGLSQAGLDVAYSDYLTEQAYPYEQLSYLQNTLLPLAQLTQGQDSTQTTTSKSSPSLASSLTGLASMAMGIPGVSSTLGSGLMSMGSSIGLSGLTGFGTGLASGSGLGSALRMGQGASAGMYGPGFAKGGKVSPPSLADFSSDTTIWEMNDLLSQISPELAKDLAYDPKLDVEMYPGGPTRREMMRMWEAEGLGNYGLEPGYIDGGMVKKGYKCGGKVKHYANGGLVDTLINRFKNPLGYDVYEGKEGLSRWDKFTTLPVEEQEKRETLAQQPSMYEALQTYLTSPLNPSFEEAQGIASMEKNVPTPQRRPESVQNKAIEDKVNEVLAQIAPSMGGKQKQTQTMPQEQQPIQKQEKEEGINMPLFLFGASLLSSSGKNFFEALGDAGKVYATTKMSKEEAIREKANEALKQQMEERRLRAYEKQTDTAAAKAPYAAEIERLKLEALKRKASEDPTMQKLILELAKTDPISTPDEILAKANVLRSATQMMPQQMQAGLGQGKFLGFE